MNQPYGGLLVNKLVDDIERANILDVAKHIAGIKVSARTVNDLEMIGTGVYSPLEGFMGEDEYDSVVDRGRLLNGLTWTIPITLPIDSETYANIRYEKAVVLKDEEGTPLALLEVTETYPYNPYEEAKRVYGTDSTEHPGVRYIFSQGEYYMAGKIKLIQLPKRLFHNQYFLTPQQARNIFAANGWKTIVGFQTRNPIHRAHEHIQKLALEFVDGLFINPLVGNTKADDVDAETRIESYLALIDNYYPKHKVQLGFYPAAMRYAGPKEAVLHAISRKNYGCTHFIMGRDHAGVGNFYRTYEAQEFVSQFDLGIQTMFFEHAFYCKRCEGMVTERICPHDETYHVKLSGSKVREMLREGKDLPREFSRPEVAMILKKSYMV